MESDFKKKRLRIDGMTCTNCQNKIERKLRNTAGIKQAKVSYNSGTADITYDTDIISLKDISEIIEKLGYKVLTRNEQSEPGTRHSAGILLIIMCLYILLQQSGILNMLVPSQLAQTSMSLECFLLSAFLLQFIVWPCAEGSTSPSVSHIMKLHPKGKAGFQL